MRNAAEYARRVKRLFTRIKREGSRTSLATVDDSMRALLLGIFSNFTTEQRAAAALDRLLSQMVDLNELRVTPVAEIVACVGADHPHCRDAAEEISQVLNALFNMTHELDLSFLKAMNKKAAASFLDALDGIRPQTKAFFKQRYLNIHAIPLDANMYSFLGKSECIADNADVEQAQRFLAGVIRERDGMRFYALLKRYASAHAPRKPSAAPRPAPARKTAARRAGASRRKAATAAGRRSASRKKTLGKAAAGSKKKKTAERASRKKSAKAKKAAGARRTPAARRGR